MTLQHCVIHRLQRPDPSAELKLQLRDQENECLDTTFSLVEQLKQSFRCSSQKHYGGFDSTLSENPLPGWFKDYLADKSSFLTLSQALMQHLKQQMGDHQEPFDAHIMLALDKVMEQGVIYLFWINHTDSVVIDNHLSATNVRHIDTARLQYALRLQIEDWQEQSHPKYLTVLQSRGNKTLADSFNQFIGFSAGLDVVEDTHEFLDIVNRYAESLPEEEAQPVKTKILDYCVEQDKSGEPVKFSDISSQLEQSAEVDFSDYVSSQQQQPRDEIYADRASLKRYMRFFGRDNAMSISFSSELYGEDIVFDERTETLTLKRIPKSLKQQLLKEKQSQAKDI